MSLEDRLREAVRREVDEVEPSPGGWDRIEAQVTAAERRRRARRGALAVLSAAAAVLLVVGAVTLIDGDDGQDVGTVPADTSAPPATPSSTASPTTVTEPPAPPSAVPAEAIWPLDPSPYGDAVEAAEAFMREYVGMEDPVGRVQEGDDSTTYVEIRRTDARGRAATRVHVIWLGDAAYVTAATTDQIRVDEPGHFQLVTSPMEIRGAASAFEGNVVVEVREDRMLAGESLGQGIVTGSGGEDLGPFSGSIEFREPSQRRGAVVLTISSPEDGGIEEAAVLRVQFPAGTTACEDPAPTMPPAEEGTTRTVSITLSCGEDLVQVSRRVAETDGVLRAALEQLLGGPTPAEEAAGLTSFFSAATSDTLLGVTVRDGRAIVDLDGRLPDLIPGASTSAGSAALVGQLNGTVFQFATVEEVEYRLDGSCEAFFNWLQGTCQIIGRPSPG